MGDLLEAVLRDAQHRGYLGAGLPSAFIRHAHGYLDGLDAPALVGPCVDLGSGSGIPGLVLALDLPDARWHLVERSEARADWLRRAVARLGVTERVHVRNEPAEATGRGALRHTCAVVVGRAFAAPAVAAECAAPLLVVGGRAIFSDRRDRSARWDADGLAQLGLTAVRSWHNDDGGYVALEQHTQCPERFPRSPGVPARRPLF